MANSDKLAEVTAMLAERDEEFRPFEDTKITTDSAESFWSLSDLKNLLGYEPDESIQKAVDRAKISASKAGISIKEHFCAGDMFDHPEEMYVSTYAAILVTMNADVRKHAVAIAQNYFALQVDRQALEDEKRIRARYDVTVENHKLSGVASSVGVTDFQKFNGVGVSALYGNRNVAQIRAMKGLKKTQSHLDYAGSEELAANLFRITQTAAALRRQLEKDEAKACRTHVRVAEGVRNAIIRAGNTPPEKLPPATTTIDKVATQVKRGLKAKE